MGGIRFELKPVAEKPKSSFVKRSKYDPIIDRFLSGGYDLVKVEIENKKANYIRGQLLRIIDSRGLKHIMKDSVVNGELYLEKIKRGR